MSKNLCAKTKKISEPYEIWQGIGKYEGWEWKVLKKWQSPENEVKNPYARWFCFVSSPLCPEGEYGDTYISDIIPYAKMVKGNADLQKVMRKGFGLDDVIKGVKNGKDI